MPGARRTHDYPHGKPFSILLTEIALAVIVILWVGMASRGWRYALSIIMLFLLVALIRGRFLKKYELTGEAVRIPPA